MRSKMTTALRSMRTWARPAIAAPYVGVARATSLPPDRLFRHMTQKEWGWLNLHGPDTFPSLARYLPTMPSKETQVRFTGGHSLTTLQEAFAFYQIVAQATSSTHRAAAMDFGCGWGRMTRFFIKDYPKDKLFGVDPISEMIDLCEETNPWATFKQIDLRPPIDLPSSSLSVIFAFSVFSHLTEDVHLQWIEEFARLLQSGGTLVVTTRERDFILECARLRSEDRHLIERDALSDLASTDARSAFVNHQRYLDLYDAGEYCCDPVGAGEKLPTSTYGETCIPLAYAQRRWAPHLSVDSFLDYVPGLKQNVIVARRA